MDTQIELRNKYLRILKRKHITPTEVKHHTDFLRLYGKVNKDTWEDELIIPKANQ